jgi:hypothetical protein
MVNRFHADPAEMRVSSQYYRSNELFDRSGVVGAAELKAVVQALQQTGDLPAGFDPQQLLLKELQQ